MNVCVCVCVCVVLARKFYETLVLHASAIGSY